MSNAEIKTYASWIKGQRAVYTAEMEAKGNTRLSRFVYLYVSYDSAILTTQQVSI